MAEQSLPSSVAIRRVPFGNGLGQIVVVGYLLAGLAALLSIPLLEPGWLKLEGLAAGTPQSDVNFPYFIGLAYLASGFWVFAIRRHQIGGLAYALFSTATGLAVGLLGDILTVQRFSILWTISMAMVAGSFAALAILFPDEDPMVTRHPWMRWSGYVVAGGLGIAFIFIPGFTQLSAGSPGAIISLFFVVTAFLFNLVWLGLRRMRVSYAMEREQVRLMLLSCLISFGPMAIGFVAWLLFPERIIFSTLLTLPMLIFPALSGYSVQRFRLLQVDLLLNRAVVYGLLAILTALGYALLAGGLGLVFTGSLGFNDPVYNGLAFFVLALVLLPLRLGLQQAVDAMFFRGQRAYQARVQTFSGELTTMVDMNSIIKTLRGSIESSLLPSALHIFVYDALFDQYSAASDEQGHPTSDLRFPASSPLVAMLGQQRFPLFIRLGNQLPANLQPDQNRLNLLGVQLFAPLSGRQRLAGWLALGTRRSGEPYTNRELAFLDALCDQAVLAIERAQVVVNMETRVRETNVLARIAQGVNITLTLDDTLELIYAQTTQVIAADEFHMILTNRDTDQLVEVFTIIGDERLSQYENRAPAWGSPLEEEVIRLRRPILAEDYNQECQKRGILSNRTDIAGWMCVPLNAGAETIGTISLSNRDPSTRYIHEQLQLLQAIADQVAGAIVKVRLLEETERRARQLSSLNEVTRQLTSTLELEPLLSSILKSAVDILNCEAGSLLLVDDNTGELVFRATAGPVAGNLKDTRLPPGTGLAGKAVRERTPLVVNDVQNTSAWFQQTDKKTGFSTRSILVIPLMVKGLVTGVVEVINKKDGSAFAQDDLELLSTFAAQASVAVENARQFTMTDQALTARVDELSIMQRIDRELNTSLDVATTMKLTLEWAMRQSEAAAGLIGVVEENGLKVMASQGYTHELEPYEETPLPIAGTPLELVVESGSAQRVTVNGEDSTLTGLLVSAASQVILPIRRETSTIGLMLVESEPVAPLSDETLGFLQRLSDHAAVAISNAQLYATIQAANVAKSEFVSFVSHELKNPMTSIKGYTELLAAGAVGAVNEAQANFLSTIRSNIERMNTLVSDLNDVSKIEAGRLRLDFKAQPLSAAIDDIVRSTRRQIEEKSQTLSIQLPDQLPEVWADRTRLAQVLVNLVSNAHKYTPQNGKITVSAEACQNEWDSNGASQVVHIWVQDNGIGINPEDQKRIFQKFFRSEDPKTREVPGTGLGLNITRSLVEMQGGIIWFESEYRQGTTFHFTIPVAE